MTQGRHRTVTRPLAPAAGTSRWAGCTLSAALVLGLGCGGAPAPVIPVVADPTDPGDASDASDASDPGDPSNAAPGDERGSDVAQPAGEDDAGQQATSGDADAAPSPQPGLSREAAAILAAHNRVRADHCARPLRWSQDLAATAQQWADALRDSGCRFEHSNTGYGENLAAGTQLSAANAVTLWAEEADDYNYQKPTFSMQTGHFTQMVWRATRMLGCGFSECQGMRLWVCHYDPPGNVRSLFADNVLATGCR